MRHKAQPGGVEGYLAAWHDELACKLVALCGIDRTPRSKRVAIRVGTAKECHIGACFVLIPPAGPAGACAVVVSCVLLNVWLWKWLTVINDVGVKWVRAGSKVDTAHPGCALKEVRAF